LLKHITKYAYEHFSFSLLKGFVHALQENGMCKTLSFDAVSK